MTIDRDVSAGELEGASSSRESGLFLKSLVVFAALFAMVQPGGLKGLVVFAGLWYFMTRGAWRRLDPHRRGLEAARRYLDLSVQSLALWIAVFCAGLFGFIAYRHGFAAIPSELDRLLDDSTGLENAVVIGLGSALYLLVAALVSVRARGGE